MKKYGDIIGVRQNFDDTFNLIQEKPDSWKSFITNTQFEENLKRIIRSLSVAAGGTQNDRKSIWVQGTYGTGKSHSTSVVKHILCDDISEIEDFVKTITDVQLKEEIKKFRANSRVFPVVMKGRYAITDVKDMSYVIQKETREALLRANIELNIKTDYEVVIKLLDNENYDSFWNGLLKNELSTYCQTKADIKEYLEASNKDILSIISKRFKSDINASFGTTDITKWLKEVKKELVPFGYDSLLIIWDEFTSLLSGEESRSFLNTVQDIAELSKGLDEKGNPENVFIFLVTHKAFEQTDAYKKKNDEERKLALDRFLTITYEMQPYTTYHILSSTLDRKDEAALNGLIEKNITGNFAVKKLIDRIAESTGGIIEEVKQKIVSLYPFHPYTAYLSTFVSRQLGASERSVFNFLNDSEVGFKKFLECDISTNPFLRTDHIWDFFIKISESNTLSAKLTEVIGRYNMYYNNVKSKGEIDLHIYKTVLLLNVLNSVVSAGDSRDERSLVVPNEENIISCYVGVYDDEQVKDVLNYLDANNMVVKSPDGIYEVTTAAISKDELIKFKKAAYENFNQITNAFGINVLETLDPLKKLITKNNNQTMRAVSFLELSATLKDSQIESLVRNRLSSCDHSLLVVMVFAHGPYESLARVNPPERSIDEIQESLLCFSKSDEFKDIVFSCCLGNLPETEFERFIDDYAKSQYFSSTGSKGEEKSALQNATGRIKKWIRECVDNEYFYVTFNGKEEQYNARELAKEICDSYIPHVFKYGLDRIKKANNEAIWKEATSRAAIEAILNNDKRSEVENKLRSGNTTIKCLLKDSSDNYLFDENMNFIGDINSDEPICRLMKSVDTAMTPGDSTPIIHVGDNLSTIFKPPFGYYNNPISASAIALVLRKYINKIFTADNGSQIDKSAMRDLIEALFKYVLQDKPNSKLSVRFSTEEENKLIKELNDLFGESKKGLEEIKWAIRGQFTGKYKAPLWMLKYAKSDIKSSVSDVLTDLFAFTCEAGAQISQTVINQLLNKIKSTKIDLKILLKDVESIDLLKNYISLYLSKESKIEINDENVEKAREYIIEHINEEISLWKQSDVETQILRFAIKRSDDAGVTPASMPYYRYDNQQVGDDAVVEEEKGNSATIDMINNCDDIQTLKSILKDILNRYPSAEFCVRNYIKE